MQLALGEESAVDWLAMQRCVRPLLLRSLVLLRSLLVVHGFHWQLALQQRLKQFVSAHWAVDATAPELQLEAPSLSFKSDQRCFILAQYNRATHPVGPHVLDMHAIVARVAQILSKQPQRSLPGV